MKRVLFSWVAFNNDFNADGSVNIADSPNYLYHKYFYQHDMHYILSASADDDLRAIRLMTTIKQDFQTHNVEISYMGVEGEVINLKLIKTKIEKLLLDHHNDEIDIFFSPGTSIMQLSWYICHTSLGLNTRLLQTSPRKYWKKGKPELFEITTGRSGIPMSATLKENIIDEKGKGKIGDYKITRGIERLYDKADKIAQTDKVTVLIQGDSGTGKEHLAKYIHDQSARKGKAFIAVNCSAFQDSLLESRLFGFKKGSFTGADKDTKGQFELVNSGTIFLDEIGDISPYMQQSLLRVIQEKEIQPIGGKILKIDVRIIAATNKDLNKLCTEGKFRWDLYYRLAVAELEVPSLLQRGQNDIKELIDHFISTKKKELHRPKQLKITAKLLDYLTSYPYPGNVRELENLIESLYIYYEDKPVDIKELPERFTKIPEGQSLKWQDVEKQLITKVLKLKNGNKNQSLAVLGYGSINTLQKKIKEYNITI